MNKLQRRNQRAVAKALGKPLLVTSIYVGSGRLIDVQTATWEEYWGRCDFAAEEIQRLHEAWNALIEGGYSVEQRKPFVQAYFALLRTCLNGHSRGEIDLSVLRRVHLWRRIAFDCST